MCAGRPPFRAETTMAVLRRVCEQAPAPLREVNPEVPDWLAAIIAKLHAKDPHAHYSSAAEVAELLGHHLSLLRQPELAESFEEPRKPVASSRKAAAAAALLLMVVTIGLGAARAGGLPALESLVATVFQIKTSEGILKVQVDDPDVKLKVNGEELVLTGTGPQEFRYRPGPHQLVAIKNGVAVKDEIVVIKRGDKEIVTISREGDPAAAAAGTGTQASPAPELTFALGQTRNRGNVSSRIRSIISRLDCLNLNRH